MASDITLSAGIRTPTMPNTFDINPSAIPFVRTRQALLILDLQNNFVSPDGALFAEEPEGYVERILDLAKAFRGSGAGDVIWVRSEFDSHCSLLEEEDQIITADTLLRPKKPAPSRGRQPTSTLHEKTAMEEDDEAFLSTSAEREDKPCIRKGTLGSEFAPEVKAAMVAGRDIVLTKTHYSAFASGQQQLVQLLRGRFVTQLYVCGALTNVSIYATALGAGQHGYEVTLVEDCCGFRSSMRHLNAVRQLSHLTGCDMLSAETLLEQWQPPPAPAHSLSTGLSPAVSKISLQLGGSGPLQSASPPAAAGPRPVTSASATPASPQPVRAEPPKEPPPHPRGAPRAVPRVASPTNQSSAKVDTKRPSTDTEPLDAESDKRPRSDSRHRPEKKPEEARRNAYHRATPRQSELESSKGPALDVTPGPGSAKAEKPRVINRVRQRVQRTSSDKKPPASSSSDHQIASAVRNKTAGDTSTKHPEVQASAEPPAPPTSTPQKPIPDSESGPQLPPVNPPANSTANPPSNSTANPPANSTANPPANPTANPPVDNMADQETRPVCSEPLCEGDTTVITNVLPPALAADAFERLLEEVSWAGMSHMGGEVPRRIAVQGTVAEDGSMPVYRHPADESPPLLPFTSTVRQIKDEIEKHLGHPLNHVLIQHYRTGADYISEHSDKTLDIAKGTFIANVSLGAERTMVFRTKRAPKPSPTTTTTSPPPPPRQTTRVPLPHNSLLKMGLSTNTHHLHAIRPDKRPLPAKSPAELSPATAGARISLTFRQIATFLSAESDTQPQVIWGQGATSKTREGAREVINGQTDDAVRLLQAFGRENNLAGEFEWEEAYGAGFDVLHMGVAKRVFVGTAPGAVVDGVRVGIALAEAGVGFARGSVEGAGVRFEENDPGRAVVEGVGGVLRYLDAVYGAGRRYDQMLPGEVAKRFGRLEKGLELGELWRGVVENGEVGEKAEEELKGEVVKVLGQELAQWEGWAKEAGSAAAAATPAEDGGSSGGFFIAGTSQPSPADFAVWPVLHDMVRVCGEEVLGENLRRYYAAFKERSSVTKALGPKGEKAA